MTPSRRRPFISMFHEHPNCKNQGNIGSELSSDTFQIIKTDFTPFIYNARASGPGEIFSLRTLRKRLNVEDNVEMQLRRGTTWALPLWGRISLLLKQILKFEQFIYSRRFVDVNSFDLGSLFCVQIVAVSSLHETLTEYQLFVYYPIVEQINNQ